MICGSCRKKFVLDEVCVKMVIGKIKENKMYGGISFNPSKSQAGSEEFCIPCLYDKLIRNEM